jgi:hypothetical protein
MLIDKSNILEGLRQGSLKSIKIELGCGNKKRNSSSIGIDQLDFESVDIVGDAVTVLKEFPAESVALIESYHFMEHVIDLKEMVAQCARVLNRGGVLRIVVPHFSNPYFYSDYTHRSFFGLYTLSYLARSSLFKRVVPTYGNDFGIEITDVKLIFRGERPFYIRHAFGLILTRVINSSNFLKEFYEINLSKFYSCHEIRFTVVKCG